MKKNKKLGESICKVIGTQLLLVLILTFVWAGIIEGDGNAPAWLTIAVFGGMALLLLQGLIFSKLYEKRKEEMLEALEYAREFGTEAKIAKIEADLREFRAFAKRGCFTYE